MAVQITMWLIIAIVLGIIEATTVNLVTIWLSLAALGSAVAAALGVEPVYQFLIFAVLSAVLLYFTRPLAKKFNAKKKESTNADRVIGQKALVIKEIDPIENAGQVKVLGQVWSARGDGGESFAVGEKVMVLKIEGVKLIVEKIS